MKTKILLSVLTVFLFTVNIYANKPETITLSNIEKTENGCVKEFLSCDKNTNAPISKTVYRYDAEDRMQEKATYEWNSNEKEWVGTQKYVYSYEKDNQLSAPSVSILKWNKKIKDWTEK